jgi:ketosteroid isomerase-like protein
MEHFRPSPAGSIDHIAVHLETAFNAGDAKTLASLYSDDATLMPPNEPMVSGRREIQTWFERALQRLRSVRIVPIESKIVGDQAFEVGTFTSRAK